MKIKALVFTTILLSIIFGCKKKVDTPDTQIPSIEVEEEEKEIPCNSESAGENVNALSDGNFTAKYTSEPIKIDGCGKDSMWSIADWNGLNFTWLGATPAITDYQGKFKVLLDANYLYLFVEVVDDSLNQTLANGIDNYWKGDYVEVFLDEDTSGGNHQYNHQAFAYHVSTEGHAIDKNTKQETVFFDDHIEVMRTRNGTTHYWEMAIKIFNDQFDENSSQNTPVTLQSQKMIGFSLAYGDNDGNNDRENFMGSKRTHGVNNDEGYINADVFGTILLVD